MTSPVQSDRIRGLDGLRALALVAVFLQHNTAFGRSTEMGSYGVWLFFALSGFLIIRILHRERRAVEAGDRSVGQGLGRFFWRRALRIMPIYYLVLAVFSVLTALGIVHDFAPGAGWHFAYLSNIYFGEVFGQWGADRFGYFWSLAIEEQFYLLAAPVLLVTPSRLMRNLCGGLVLAALTQHFLMRLNGASTIQAYTNSLVNFGVLAFGGYVGLLLPAKPQQGRGSGLALAGLVGFGVLIYSFTQVAAQPAMVASLVDGLPLVAATLVAGLTLAGVFLNQGAWIVRVLEWKPLAGFGRISYGFYLYHNLLPHWSVSKTLRHFGWVGSLPRPVEAAFMFTATLAMALLSWRFIERPLLRLKDRPPKLPFPAPREKALCSAS